MSVALSGYPLVHTGFYPFVQHKIANLPPFGCCLCASLWFSFSSVFLGCGCVFGIGELCFCVPKHLGLVELLWFILLQFLVAAILRRHMVAQASNSERDLCMNFGFIGKWLCTYAETCLSAFQDPLDPSTALGGFSGNKYSEASAFVVTYPVNNAVDDIGNENGKALAWEKAFIQLAKDELLPMVLSRNLSLIFGQELNLGRVKKRKYCMQML